jgi:hypothetical protein
VLAGGVAAARDPDVADVLSAPAERVWEQLEGAVPALRSHPKLVLGAVGLAALGGAFMWRWVAFFLCIMRVMVHGRWLMCRNIWFVWFSCAPAERVWQQLEGAVPALRSLPKLVLAAVGLAALGAAFMWRWVPIRFKAACGVMRPHGGCGSGAVRVYVCGSVAALIRSLGTAYCGVNVLIHCKAACGEYILPLCIMQALPGRHEPGACS